jgi:hypothetical protein
MVVRRRRPPQVGTIGGLIACGLKRWISCDTIGCRNNADVDLVALRDQLPISWRSAGEQVRREVAEGLVGIALIAPIGDRWREEILAYWARFVYVICFRNGQLGRDV